MMALLLISLYKVIVLLPRFSYLYNKYIIDLQMIFQYTFNKKGCEYMKLEKISDTQIRCTLNREDLNERQLRISELAYGSEKARALFREMMQQASYELGFETDDIPLMIESIPISPDCLVLNITKVEEPDELDTRFSNFTPSIEIEDISSDNTDYLADEILNCFEHIAEIINKKDQQKEDNDNTNVNFNNNLLTNPLIKLFSFSTFKEVAELSHILIPFFFGDNTLYKNPLNNRYYLKLSMSDHTPEDFNKVCNIISEFGKTERVTYATMEYFNEHYEIIIKDNALQVLSEHY